MRRPGITVREARRDDIGELEQLWIEARAAAGPASHTLGSGSADALLGRIDRAERDPERKLMVALHDRHVVGVACFTFEGLSPLDEDLAVHIPYLHVLESHRRHGVGSALLSAAADFAETNGAQHVIVSVPQTLREANRFYARLGLAPVVAHRSAATATLRRRLEGDAGDRIHEVISQRRRARTLLTRRSLRPAGEASES